MSQSPWQVPEHDPQRSETLPSPDREIRPARWARFIVFTAGLALLLFGLSLAFPDEGVASDPYLVRALVILFIFGGAAAFWSRSSLMRLAKIAGLWVLILAAIVIFYLYRSDLGERFMTAVDPAGVTETEEGLLIVHKAVDGHFWLRADLNGVPVRLMVDTGASNIVLSPADAKRVGLDPAELKFNALAGTANGDVAFARATVRLMTVGDKAFYDVPVTVNGAPMQGSLFGMSALNRFTSVEFRSDVLLLRP